CAYGAGELAALGLAVLAGGLARFAPEEAVEIGRILKPKRIGNASNRRWREDQLASSGTDQMKGREFLHAGTRFAASDAVQVRNREAKLFSIESDRLVLATVKRKKRGQAIHALAVALAARSRPLVLGTEHHQAGEPQHQLRRHGIEQHVAAWPQHHKLLVDAKSEIGDQPFLVAFRRHRHDAGLGQELSDCRIGGAYERQTILQHCQHKTFRIMRIAEPVRGTRRYIDGAGRGKRAPLACSEQFPLPLVQQKNLKQGFVAVERNLPIVQAAALRKRFAMQPEIPGFIRILSIKPVDRYVFYAHPASRTMI